MKGGYFRHARLLGVFADAHLLRSSLQTHLAPRSSFFTENSQGPSSSSTAATRSRLQGGGSASGGSAAAEDAATPLVATVNAHRKPMPTIRPHGQPEPSTGDGVGGGGAKHKDEAAVFSRRSTSTKGKGKLVGRGKVAVSSEGGGSAVAAPTVGGLESDTSRAKEGEKPLSLLDWSKPGGCTMDELVSKLNLLYRMQGITLDTAFYSNLLGKAFIAAKTRDVTASNALAAGGEAGNRRVDGSGGSRSGSGSDPAQQSKKKRKLHDGGGTHLVSAASAGQTSKKATAAKKRAK